MKWLAGVTVALVLAPSFARAADPTHYQLNAKLDLAHGVASITADVAIDFKQPDEIARFLLSSSFNIREARADEGASVAVDPAKDQSPATISVRSSRAASATLHIAYDGPLAASAEPNLLSPGRIELSADSLWYPISTNFNAHITLNATILGIPSDFTIVSPDRLIRSGDAVIFERTRPSQDIAFVAAPDLQHRQIGKLDFYAADLTNARVQGFLENGPLALASLEKWFGPLPTEHVAVAVVRRANGVGYSRPGYVVVADTSLPAADEVWARAGYLAHEISHAWWSNADFTGEDYWLVESTAEYSALRFVEHRYDVDTRRRMLDAKRPRAKRAGPLLGHGRPSADAVYAKGPILLFELEARIGRPALDRILATLASRPRITTKDFLEELETESGAAEKAAFEAKLRQ